MNEQKIWNFLYSKIQNPYGVAALMGNLYVESGLNPKNLQNTYEKKLGMTDNQYTEAVDNGTYDNFVHDSAGYGLAQWTYHSRKANLLKFANETGASIGDLDMQLNFLLKELQAYSLCYKTIIEAKSIREASDILVTKYEKPADQSEKGKQNRANFGQKYYDMFVNEEGSEDSLMEESLYKATVEADSGKAVRMRSQPSTDANVLFEIPNGTSVNVIDVLDGWCQILYNNKVGYMMSKFLKQEDSDEIEKNQSTNDVMKKLKNAKERLTVAINLIKRIENS
jgi:uncharacterized protein YgiM (DUF1202 family)